MADESLLPQLDKLKLSPSAGPAPPDNDADAAAAPSTGPPQQEQLTEQHPADTLLPSTSVNAAASPSAPLAATAQPPTLSPPPSSAANVSRPSPLPTSPSTASPSVAPALASSTSSANHLAFAQRPGQHAQPGAAAAAGIARPAGFGGPIAGRPPAGAGVPGRPPPRGLQGPMGMRAPMGMGAVGGGGAPAQLQTRLPPSLQAKMDKLAAQRSSAPSPMASNGVGPNPQAASMGALLRQQAMRSMGQPIPGAAGPPAVGPNAGPLGLAARRAGRPLMSLNSPSGPPRALPGAARGGIAGRRGPPGGLSLAQLGGGGQEPAHETSKFSDFNQIMDPSGSLKFSKAVLHAGGVDFGDGQSFKINMDEMEVLGELGKGNYGSVQKVYHRPTGVMMAMKEIRLELDESKLNGIIMELDILHRAVAPEIVEFYGAFTIESCVYYCMEYMDAGSLDKLTGTGQVVKTATSPGEEERDLLVPEPVLRRITAAIVRGLSFLKDELQIMHRDVKPTNVLINTKGEVKLCDFGVSGQLEKSLAKTNIGCQSYMAPERIKGESQNQVSTYTVSSDVWSVGLSIIEIAKGTYPYPPETFANVFAQLTAIVNGPAPTLPKGYSADAHDFVAKCLLKDPNQRPTYAQLLEHPFLKADKDADVDMAGWVASAMERQSHRGVVPLQEVEV
ncbi:Protein kinase wis1 [Vanrija pseudolonga]|uniref:mitogen-activated protein kinase kinase n=1 Tax=Vanrija pseudolonga TaxID=143232 RepID=A0AAF1BGH8_9TREE|nr:Protein kinase wis1 [Vanrija pseudolonga]